MATAVRRLRHWKQRYDPNAAFVWRKSTTYRATIYPAGSIVPDEIIEDMGRVKLRRFWEAGRIELSEFEAPSIALPTRPMMKAVRSPEEASNEQSPEQAPTEAAPEAEAVAADSGISVKSLGGPWFLVTIDGESEKVRGRKNLEAMVGTAEEVDALLIEGALSGEL